MAHWLVKTEPGTYSFADLVRDGQTVWDGITNNTALIHLRAMKKGDMVFIYHTGGEKQIVGVAEISAGPRPDPKLNDPKIVVVTLCAKRALGNSVTLEQIKSDPVFAGWDLLRIGRLSVVPVPEKMFKRVEELSNTKGK